MNPLKRFELYVSAIFKLGRIERLAKEANRRVSQAEVRMDAIEIELAKLGESIHGIWEKQTQLEQDIRAEIAATNSEALGQNVKLDTLRMDYHANRAEISVITRLISKLTLHAGFTEETMSYYGDTQNVSPNVNSVDKSFELFKDGFYHRLENRYRGSEEEIGKRLSIYVPEVEAAYLRTGKLPVMDLGCGRGEWLALLQLADIDAFGVDTNAVQIEAAKQQGLDVRIGDAVHSLREMKDNSLSVLSAHHLVEHLPFDTVALITREALRVLAPGGLLLFETPNTRNVLVGATTFYTDPTHLKPMPEQVLTVLFETAGFEAVEARGLHSHERFEEFLAKPDFNDELAFLMFGPQDLTVIGTKPVIVPLGD